MKKLRDTKVLTTCAMLLAIAVIFGFFKIPISDVAEIRLQFLPVALSGMLFGPAVGGVIGGLTDVLGFLVKPTGPFFPGFTITGIIQGALYGFMLRKKELSIKRIVVTQLLDTLVVSVILNTVNLSILYGQGIMAVLGARIIKTVVMLPVNILLLTVVLRAGGNVYKRIIKKA